MAQAKLKPTNTKAAARGTEKKKAAKAAYEPPRLTKFDKLEKLIVCGE